MPTFFRPLNSVSRVSSTTRLAPMESIAWPRRMNNPSRSYSPVSSISLPLDVNVVDRQLPFLDQIVQVEAERTDILRQFFRGFLEGEEHSRLVVQRGSADQEFDPQQTSCRSRRRRKSGWAGLGAARRR